LEITTQELYEARQSFITERIAIMIHDGGLSEETAVEEANDCWEKYLKNLKRLERVISGVCGGNNA
jgi:hypothetical protein